MNVQTGLCRTWSKTRIVGFLMQLFTVIEYFRDLSLFSLIDSIWSGTKGAVDSQDSQNSVTEGKQVGFKLLYKRPNYWTLTIFAAIMIKFREYLYYRSVDSNTPQPLYNTIIRVQANLASC